MKKREPYRFPLEHYVSEEKFQKIKDFSVGKQTPFLIIDIEVIRRRFIELSRSFPSAKIYYAVKSNPMNEVVTALADLGSNFDVATRFELDQLLSLGISPDRMSFGNTIKKEADIAYAYQKGVRLFVTDCEQDLEKLARSAPGSKVFFRILTDGKGADWPLSRKFGAHPDMIYSLILRAAEMGLVPFGISFHVGSQQRDIGQWDDAISRCKYLFQSVEADEIHLRMINIGGGFPASYIDPTYTLDDYAREIKRFIDEDFEDNQPLIYIEPGRSLTADAGIIVAETIMTAEKARNNMYRWVFVDIGKFGGLIETIDECIKFPIYVEKEGMAEEVIIAGPTCDSMDILYENFKYKLPETLEPGDRMYFFTTGAYTQTYSSVYFNGFPPLKAYVLE